MKDLIINKYKIEINFSENKSEATEYYLLMHKINSELRKLGGEIIIGKKNPPQFPLH